MTKRDDKNEKMLIWAETIFDGVLLFAAFVGAVLVMYGVAG